MKKHVLILAAAAAFLAPEVHAQNSSGRAPLPATRKGNLSIGSGIGLANIRSNTMALPGEKYNYDVSITPTVGYFLTDHWMLSAAILGNASASTTEYARRYRSLSAGLGLSARYYFGKSTRKDGDVNKLRFYGEGGLSVRRYWERIAPYNSGGYTLRSNNLGINLGAGASYFINEHAAFEAGLNWSNQSFGNRRVIAEESQLQIQLGMRFFISR